MVWLQERIQGESVSGEYEKIAQLRDESPKMSTDEFAKVVRALTTFHETDLDLSAITAPTLVLYGEHDAGFIRRHAPRPAETIPNATLQEIPEGGHASNLDNLQFFTAATREFLARNHPQGRPTVPENTRTERAVSSRVERRLLEVRPSPGRRAPFRVRSAATRWPHYR